MTPNDLRIGNSVYNASGEIITITAKDLLDSETRPLEGWQMLYKPIPLTNEILEKSIGQILQDDAYWLNCQASEYRPLQMRILKSSEHPNGWYIALWDESEEIVIFDGEEYYLHQLENLYNSLTRGKELKNIVKNGSRTI